MKISYAIAIALVFTTASTGIAKTVQGGYDDAEIMRIVLATNEAEIHLANLAKGRTATEPVKIFADHMIKEHSANSQKMRELANKLKITPDINPTVTVIDKDADIKLDKLKGESKENFDVAYIDAQIKDHEMVLSDLDKKLIPQAKSPALKNFLIETKKAVTVHLQHAQTVRQKL